MSLAKLLTAALVTCLLAACAQQPAAEPRIVYFTTRASMPWELLSPANLRSALAAQPVSEWSEVLAWHAAAPLDGLLIDGKLAGEINREELSQLYRQCVVLAFFNLYSPEVAALVSDASIREGSWMDGSDPYPGDFYIIVQRQASGSFGHCGGAAPVQDGLAKSRAQYSLDTSADFNVFMNVFRLGLADSQ